MWLKYAGLNQLNEENFEYLKFIKLIGMLLKKFEGFANWFLKILETFCCYFVAIKLDCWN